MDHTYENACESSGEELLHEDDNETVTASVADCTDDYETNDSAIGPPSNPEGTTFYSKLIQIVRTYPNLYDKFDPGFKSPVEREKSWLEIAKQMSTSVAFVQNRWTRLRERFAKEKKALEVMQRGGNVNERKRLWPYFLPMLFLSSHIKSRRKANENLPGDLTISKFLSVMGESLLNEDTVTVKKEVEIIDENNPEYLAWKKRKPCKEEAASPGASPSQPPRKILAKPDGSSSGFTTVMLAKGKDGESKVISKLPPGAVVIKGPPGALGNGPMVLVPTAPPPGANLQAGAKTATALPAMFLSNPTPLASSKSELPPPNSAEHHFGMLIARELERYPPDVRNKKKQRILMVLYE